MQSLTSHQTSTDSWLLTSLSGVSVTVCLTNDLSMAHVGVYSTFSQFLVKIGSVDVDMQFSNITTDIYRFLQSIATLSTRASSARKVRSLSVKRLVINVC